MPPRIQTRDAAPVATPAPPARPDTPPSTAIPPDTELALVLRSWFLALRAGNRSDQTIKTYDLSARALYWYLNDRGMPTDPDAIRREHIEAFLVDLGERTAQGTVAFRFRALAALFSWAHKNDRIQKNPMERMTRPTVKTAPPHVLTDDEIDAIIGTARGRSFLDRRDRAILLLFRWTGMRLGELAGIDLGDIDLDARTVYIVGKGDPRNIRLARPVAAALDEYLFARGMLLGPDADSDTLWVGQPRNGVIPSLSKHGIAEMIGRRAKKVGVKVHPHLFRHTFAANWMEDRQGDEQNLMEIGGWKSGAMLSKYGRATRAERAATAVDDWAEARQKRRRR